MPIFHHDVAQYSDEYDRLRLGIPTSSNFHKIITPQGNRRSSGVNTRAS
jgi:hypothetical protein